MKVEIPLEVVEHLTEQSLSKEAEIQSSGTISVLVDPKGSTAKVCAFGTCLDHLMNLSSQLKVPYVVSRLCRFIEKHGLYEQCLFKETERNKVVEGLRKEFNEFGDAPLELSGDVPAASLLLKLFFEELPEPLIPASMQSDFVDMRKYPVNSGECIEYLKCLVDQLPISAFCVLKYLSHFLLRVATHGKANGLSCANLGIIFGPIIFRPVQRDPVFCIIIHNITHHFVADYYSIFEERANILVNKDIMATFTFEKSELNGDVSLHPSIIIPGAPMLPLQVVIPPVDDLLHSCNDTHTPVLLIESSMLEETVREQTLVCPVDVVGNKMATSLPTRRKRKEALTERELLDSYNLHAFPSFHNLFKLNECPLENKHDNLDKSAYNTFYRTEFISAALIPSEISGDIDPSSHPPDPKRRELDSEENFMHDNLDEKELLKIECPMTDAYLRFLDDPSRDISSMVVNVDSSSPRLANCPMLNQDKGDSNIESDSPFLANGWSTLFVSEEPVRSQQRFIWPMSKENQEDFAIFKIPSSQNFSLTEAPLSPSAFRSYLSHQSSDLDSNVPPSPPIEQEHFGKNTIREDLVSVKQLSKKIHALKKKIWQFEERYEADYGYKPSHAEKAKFPEGKKLLSALHKARKELKALKEESHVITDSGTTGGIWLSTRDIHILEDTTNYLKSSAKCDVSKSKHSLRDTFGETMRSLQEERKLAKRPELIEEMTSEQVKDEKLAIQKILLHFESLHGKPSKTSDDRNTVRPLYERYRNVKHLLVRSSSFPVYNSKSNSCKGLQPIMEHETMDFSSVQNEKELAGELTKTPQIGDRYPEIHDSLNNAKIYSSQLLDVKYNNSNLHELPLPELISRQQYAKYEKKRLRKILREFETEFLKLNGRKVQKDEKAPVEAIYAEYKLVKARLRLLEALISKHHEHIFI